MKQVTEQDLRMPEFRDVPLEALEFRADGAIVRKDRWERGILTIAGIVGLNGRGGFEIREVIDAVDFLKTKTHLSAEAWDQKRQQIMAVLTGNRGALYSVVAGNLLTALGFTRDEE